MRKKCMYIDICICSRYIREVKKTKKGRERNENIFMICIYYLFIFITKTIPVCESYNIIYYYYYISIIKIICNAILNYILSSSK